MYTNCVCVPLHFDVGLGGLECVWSRDFLSIGSWTGMCAGIQFGIYNNGLWCSSSSVVYPIPDDGPTHPLYSDGFSMGIVRALLLISNYSNIIYVYAYVLCVCVCVRRFGGGSESGWP